MRGIAVEPEGFAEKAAGMPCEAQLTVGIAAHRPIPCFNPNTLTPTERFGLFWLVAE